MGEYAELPCREGIQSMIRRAMPGCQVLDLSAA